MEKIGLVVQRKPKTEKLAHEVTEWLKERGIEVVVEQDILAISDLTSPFPKAPSDLSCVISFGGDGTFLGAVHWIQDSRIPVLGINMGSLGFLTEVSRGQIFPILEEMLAGSYVIEKRMLLTASVIRDGREVMAQTLLNDVVINKGMLARMAHIYTTIDDLYLTTFKADGLIIATPTGSTAYSLSAGGPIVYPTLSNIVITPICPFTLTNRPLILPDHVVIKAKVGDRDFGSFLTLDGQVGSDITSEDTVVIRKAPHTLHIIQTREYNYFEVLKTKLRWSGR
ncbi:MAG: NAD(+)/NADH kinase [Deltaproteobacteria bacterium]|nr:NAD(+)/NADH kinase [Deltaproteobacteria bacterium]